MKIGTERIGPADTPIEINVTEGGQFWAEFDEERYEAMTRRELLEKLTKAVKLARETNPVDVTVLGLVPSANGRGWSSDPFEAGAGVVHAKLRGKHAREYNAWLMQAEGHGGKRFKYSSSRRESIQLARRLSAEEVREYLALRETIRVAETALEDFVGKVGIDPEDALKAARKR